MSLYVIGVVYLPEEFKNTDEILLQIKILSSRIYFDRIDEDDIDTICLEAQSAVPNFKGLKFIALRLSDSESDYSATSLWNDSRERPSGERINNRPSELEEIIHALTGCKYILGGAIGLFDGSIDSVFKGSAINCLRYLSRLLSEQWDNMENPLIIWK